MAASRIRVVVVDDQPAFRRAAAAVIDQAEHFELVGEADSGEAALRLLSRCPADLVLVDVRMPGMGGVRAAAKITALRPAVRVILVSTYDPDALMGTGRLPDLPYLRKEALTADRLRRLWDGGDG